MGLVNSASAPPSRTFRFVSASPYAVIMITGTSGRAIRTFGKRFRPLVPGMLISERIKTSVSPPTASIELKCFGCRAREIHPETAIANLATELLAEQGLNVGFVIDNEDARAHAVRPGELFDEALRGRRSETL